MPVKRLLAPAALVAAAALSAAAFAGSSHDAHRPFTIAYVTPGTETPRIRAMAKGGRAAARALGDHYLLAGTVANGSGLQLVPVYRSLIDRHVDAIASDGYTPELKPILTRVRRAGILLVASGDDIAAGRDVWVNSVGNVEYAEALADSLASQIDDRGEYAILEQQDEYPVADAWGRTVVAYVRNAYPNMKLDAIVRGTGAGDQDEVDSVKSLVSKHPGLKGLIGIVPTEAYMAAEAIIQSHEIGRIHASGNGGGSFGDLQPGFVRRGAIQLVYASDPVKLGYLTVWAAHYLLAGHRFRWGAYQVGGPVGLVRYYATHRELRLGRPLTITKANVRLYANTF
jgi:ABC-type sugar transport system substrate-binding protein